MKPMGKAAMMDTVCRFVMEFSEKIRAMGSSMSTTAQNSFTFRSGSSPASRELVGVGGGYHGQGVEGGGVRMPPW